MYEFKKIQTQIIPNNHLLKWLSKVAIERARVKWPTFSSISPHSDSISLSYSISIEGNVTSL